MERKLNSEIITQHPIYIVLYLFKLIVQTFIQKSTFTREHVPACTKYMPDIQKDDKSKWWVLAQRNTNVLATFHHKTISVLLVSYVLNGVPPRNRQKHFKHLRNFKIPWQMLSHDMEYMYIYMCVCVCVCIYIYIYIYIYILQLCKVHCHGN